MRTEEGRRDKLEVRSTAQLKKEHHKDNSIRYDTSYIGSKDVKYVIQCFRCGQWEHMQPDCRMKMEDAKYSLFLLPKSKTK